MPYQTMNADEAASYLHVPREALDRLVKNQEIPFQVQAGRTVFTRGEIDAWASQRILRLTGVPLDDYHRAATRSAQPPPAAPDRLIPNLARADWISPHLESRTANGVLRDMVKLAEKTQRLCDPLELLRLLEEREQLCSTGLPGGLAMLHPRHHAPYMVLDSFLVIGRTVQGIPFGAPDGGLTDVFFLVCCQDDRSHLHTLARLCTMCQKTGLLAAIRGASNGEEVVAAALGAEEELLKSM